MSLGNACERCRGIAGSVRKLWRNCVGGGSGHQIKILACGDRFGRWLCPIRKTRIEMRSSVLIVKNVRHDITNLLLERGGIDMRKVISRVRW